MKKRALLLPLICFLCFCSDNKTDIPELELAGIFLNGEDRDYSHSLEDLLPLSTGDYIEVDLLLYGKGADLASFVMKNENANVSTVISLYPKDEVADDFLPTEEKLQMLRYKDGIRSTWVRVMAIVESAKNEEVRIGFYLNSKAPEGEGAVCYLELTTTAPREFDKE